MYKQLTPDLNKSFDLPNPGLRAYFRSVEMGQPKVYDTPFAKGESVEDMLLSWSKTLSTIRRKWPSLYDYEIDMSTKVGPTSVRKPLKDRLQDVEHYYRDILVPGIPVAQEATDLVLKEYRAMSGLRLRSQSETILKMKKSSSSGSPYFTKRRNVTDKTMQCNAFIEGDRVYQVLNIAKGVTIDPQSIWEAPALLGWRGQEGGYSKEDTKQRVVWMFPYAINILELQLYQPLIEAAQKTLSIAPWVSLDQVDYNITGLFDSKREKDVIVCTDFTKFDQHFNYNLQSAALRILGGLMTATEDARGWIENVFPIKYLIPLVASENIMWVGKHGMASGSGGTNADETLAHRALQHEAALRNGARLNPFSMCLGDDGILSYPGIHVADVIDSYTDHGLEMNATKQYVSNQECVFLRHWHHKDYRIDGVCRGVYSTMRALGKLRYLERYHDPSIWGPEMVALRQLSIIENVKWHPLRVEFAEFCMKRDKFRLGLDLPGFLDNLEKHVVRAMAYIPDLLGYTKTLQGWPRTLGGINNWWIVKYLRNYQQ